jgi:multicomponent Na+:H+ antiporter subunit C
MEEVLAILVGLVFAVSIYLMLSGVLVRFVFGFALASNAANLLIFTAGRLEYDRPPLIAAGAGVLDGPAANALPQALVLTAIVIGFAMLTFLLVLLYRTYAETGTLDADDAALIGETDDDEPGSPKGPPERGPA